MYITIIETKELEIISELKRNVKIICKFVYAKSTFINGNTKSIKETNIAYVIPPIIKVNNIDYLMFDECNDIFVNGYDEKIKLKNFETYIKKYF